MPLYPINISIEGKLCLVIGGGKVATRKVESLLPCGAVVTIISPEAEKRIADLAKEGLLTWEKRVFKRGDLQGAMLVFAATDNDLIQNTILAEANELEIPVNVVTIPDACTFQVPASIRRGDLLITVATGGGSPALASRIRKELEEKYSPEYGQLVTLMAAVRKAILASGGTQEEHKQIFERILGSNIIECLKDEKLAEIEMRLQHILPPSCDISSILASIQN